MISEKSWCGDIALLSFPEICSPSWVNTYSHPSPIGSLVYGIPGVPFQWRNALKLSVEALGCKVSLQLVALIAEGCLHYFYCGRFSRSSLSDCSTFQRFGGPWKNAWRARAQLPVASFRPSGCQFGYWRLISCSEYFEKWIFSPRFEASHG